MNVVPSQSGFPSSSIADGHAATTWTPENETEVMDWINYAMLNGGMLDGKGNVQDAWNVLVKLRQDPENYYNTNLAIASDYFRARVETQQYGDAVASKEIEAYLDLKQAGQAPRTGPGPVSPYSELEREYMNKGVTDQVRSNPAAAYVLDSSGVGLAEVTDKFEIGLVAHALKSL